MASTLENALVAEIAPRVIKSFVDELASSRPKKNTKKTQVHFKECTKINLPKNQTLFKKAHAKSSPQSEKKHRMKHKSTMQRKNQRMVS